MHATDVVRELVVARGGLDRNAGLRARLAAQRELRCSVVDLLTVLNAAAARLAPSVPDAEDVIAAPSSVAPADLVAGLAAVARGGDSGRLDTAAFAVRNAVLLHERTAAQLEAISVLAAFLAATLDRVADAAAATSPERLVTAALGPSAQIFADAVPPGGVAADAWLGSLALTPLGRYRAAAAAATLADPTGVPPAVAAAALDLLVGPLLGDELAAAEAVDTFAELAALVPDALAAVTPPAGAAVRLAAAFASSPAECWRVRDELFADLDADGVVALLFDQAHLAGAVLPLAAVHADTSVDGVLAGLVRVWAAHVEPPSLPATTPPAPWVARDPFGDGPRGRALRLVAAEHADDPDRCLYLVRPLAGDDAAQLALVLELVEVGAVLLDRVGDDASVGVGDDAPPAVRVAALLVNGATSGRRPDLASVGRVDAVDLLRALTHLAATLAAEVAALDDVDVDDVLADAAHP
jgi:hypothetical protein